MEKLADIFFRIPIVVLIILTTICFIIISTIFVVGEVVFGALIYLARMVKRKASRCNGGRYGVYCI